MSEAGHLCDWHMWCQPVASTCGVHLWCPPVVSGTCGLRLPCSVGGRERLAGGLVAVVKVRLGLVLGLGLGRVRVTVSLVAVVSVACRARDEDRPVVARVAFDLATERGDERKEGEHGLQEAGGRRWSS